MRQLNIELNSKVEDLQVVVSEVKQGDTLGKLQEIIDKAITKNKMFNKASDSSMIECLDQNYKLQVKVRELENKCETLKNFMSQNGHNNY